MTLEFVNGLKTDDVVTIDGIGDFFVREMRPRYYFNPSTGNKKRVPKRIKVVFEASNQLKNLWNN